MRFAVGVAVLLMLPSAAFAQGNPGPFGGLFGRTPERTGREFTALDFRTSLAAQYDDTLLIDEEIPAEDVPQSGYTGGGNLGLAYHRQGDRLMLQATGGASYQEFYQERTFGATTYDASAGMRANVTTRFQVEAQARYLRSPFFRLLPSFHTAAPAVIVPGDPFLTRLLVNDNYNASVGFNSRYSRTSTLSGSVAHRETRFDDGDSFRGIRADARWRRQISRGFAFVAGYGQERIRQSTLPDDEFVHELLDIGVEYSRQLSLSQRSSFGFSTQTSVVKRPLTGRRYRLNGSMMFAKLFGKTGSLTASLARSTEFLPGFIEPLYSDNAGASLNGMPSTRTEWVNNISVGRGRFGEGSGEVLTGRFLSRLNFALTRKFGVFTQYAVFYYKMPPSAISIVSLGEASRQSFSVGINTWIPVINRLRVPRDPE